MGRTSLPFAGIRECFMRKKKINISTIILVIVFLVGLSVMLYPAVSNYLNTRNQKREIVNYNNILNSMDDSEYEKMLKKAQKYNDELKQIYSPLDNYDLVSGYEDVLDVTGTGIMGYVTIPKIDVELPIYHGTSDAVLNIAVGHVQGSTLPIGGDSTHSVISAHRGLPSATLFSDLDKLEEGDTFTVTVLNDVLTYEVKKIQIIEPDDIRKLVIVDGKDYVTLVTCTPYGINTHRLLITGERTETNKSSSLRVSADAVRIEPIIVAPIIAIPILIVLLITIAHYDKGNRKKSKGGDTCEGKKNS